MGNQQPLKLSEYKNVLLTDEKTVSCILGVLRTKKGVFFTHVCDHTTFHKQVIPNFWALEVHNINLRHITGWC